MAGCSGANKLASIPLACSFAWPSLEACQADGIQARMTCGPRLNPVGASKRYGSGRLGSHANRPLFSVAGPTGRLHVHSRDCALEGGAFSAYELAYLSRSPFETPRPNEGAAVAAARSATMLARSAATASERSHLSVGGNTKR